MSSSDLGSVRPFISADNKSSGSQFIADGHGDQNVAFGNSHQTNDYSDRRNITIVTSDSGIPSIWQAVNGTGEPTRVAIIDWFMRSLGQSIPDAQRRHSELYSQVTPGTGEWVLDNDQFQLWEDPSSSKRVLLIHGICNSPPFPCFSDLLTRVSPFEVGAGKSVLVSIIKELIQTKINAQPNTACIYFHFQDGDDSLSPAHLWATLLEQLLSRDGQGVIAPRLKSKFTESFQGSRLLHSSDYWDIFRAQADIFKTIYLILDAPDSYLNNNLQGWQGMRNALEDLPANIKLLFTSRHSSQTHNLNLTAGDCKINLTPRAADIQTYVTSRIARDANLNQVLAKPHEKEAVINRVTSLASESGMFLLARLHLDSLGKHSGTLASIKDALTHLPIDSDAVFETSVLQITKYEPFESELARHVLTWVAHAKAGLTISQVQDSFAIQLHSRGGSYHDSTPSKDLVISVSAGLIVENLEDGTLRLVHESARKNLDRHGILPKNANLAMAKTCLTCLLIGGTEEEKETPLLPYAASHWISHLGKDCHNADAEASNLVRRLFRNTTKLTRAFNIMQADPGSGLDSITELHAAVYFNLRFYVKDLIKARFDVNTRCSDGQTALHWAVKLGRHHISKYLIRNSADTNILDKTQHTPLHIALKRPVTDNILIVQRLIDGGAKLDIPGPQGLTPLSWAIQYGPTAVAEILLKNQINLNSEIRPGWTSLRELFCHDHSTPEPPGTPEYTSKSPKSAVEDHVRYLIHVVLGRGVDLNQATSDGWLPLIHAITTTSPSRVRALLNRNPSPADANKRDPRTDWSPLRWAIFRRNPTVVKLLGEHGAEMNEKNEDGWVPLIQAVQNESEDIIWALLKMGARPDNLDKQKRPALFHAVQKRNKNIVWLLATSDSKSNIRLHSKMLLEAALANEDHSIAWLLCENGADPNATDGHMTLLHRASRRGCLRDVDFLLSRGVDDARLDNEGFTALHRAVLGNFDKVVAELVSRISRQEYLNIRDSKGNTALILATLKGNKPMVQTLIHHQASCETADLQGVTAIHHAVGLGLNGLLQLMVPKASNINLPDKKGYSALHHAVRSGKSNAQTIDILVAGGADLSARTNDNETPLRLARRLKRDAFERQLQSLKESSRSRLT